MARDRFAEFTDPDVGWVPDRPLVCWMLPAVEKARAAHVAHYNAFPHTIYMGPEEYDRLVWEIRYFQDTVRYTPLYELRVYGMLVKVEER